MVEEYKANSTDATLKCGLIGDWDVSAITDMAGLFFGMTEFNGLLSNWNTSSVTDMSGMFFVRSSP